MLTRALALARIVAICMAILAFTSHAGAQNIPPAGWRPFSPDSPWNRPIPTNAPIDPNSGFYISDIMMGGCKPVLTVHADIPIYYVDATTPFYDVPITYANHSPLGGPGYNGGASVPFPIGAQPATNSDHKMVVVDYSNGVSWEFYGLQQDTSTGDWSTLWATTFDLNSDGAYYNAGWLISTQEAGNPLIGGVIRYDELKSGQINHALMMCYDFPSSTLYRYPACIDRGISPHLNSVPIGALLQLNPALNLNDPKLHLTKSAKIIARALQQYGAYMVSNANNKGLFFEERDSDPYWGGLLYTNTLSQIPLNRMRVVNTSYLLPQAQYGITGKVQLGTGASAVPMSNVALTLSSPYPLSKQAVSSDGQGQFAFTNVLNGAYTITPEAVGYSFSPSSQSVAVKGNSISGISFTATPNGQQAQYLFANSLTVANRALTSKSLAATYVMDESGTVMNPNNAMGFAPNFDGYFTFNLQNGVSPSNVKQLRFETNFWGSNPWQSLWQWQIYNWKNQTWQPLMDSSPATSNTWTYIKAEVTGTDLTPYFSPSGSLRLRYFTTSNNYSSALDFLRLRTLYLTSAPSQ